MDQVKSAPSRKNSLRSQINNMRIVGKVVRRGKSEIGANSIVSFVGDSPESIKMELKANGERSVICLNKDLGITKKL